MIDTFVGLAAIVGGMLGSDAPLVRPKAVAVVNRDWIQIPVDTFFLARLEAAKERIPDEIGRDILLSRLTRILAGCDATPTEIDRFAKSRAKRAYEKEVDRLLASPGFEEQFCQAIGMLRKDDPRSARRVAEICWRRLTGESLAASNAAALDWFASELVDPTLVNCCELDSIPAEWDLKHLVRAMVISAAYRTKP